jgi:F0F1-type ATP synthase membrane subunit b/b'
VTLDRDSIVRRDFPTNRRGYDPAAVEAHLSTLAGEIEALQRRASAPATLSEQAGEQVRAIVQAAERGAAEIRATASAEAAERVAHVTEAAEHLRARVEQMEADVTRVMSELRDEARRLHADLSALRGDAARLGAASDEASSATAPVPASAATPAIAAAAPEEAAPREDAPSPPDAEPPREEAGPRDDAAPRDTSAPANGDTAAARIVALDMALSGTPRDETDRFIAEHYDLRDRAALLDEVYAAAGG